MTKQSAIIIATEGLTTNLLYETLASEFEIKQVIIEQPISKLTLLKKRIKRIGLPKVVGQLGFVLFALPILKKQAKPRIAQLLKTYHLTGAPIPSTLIHRIQSVNSPDLIDLVHTIKPDLIFINGTRIIQGNILDQLDHSPINIHVGITPKYRGIHGGYWALHENDIAFFGVTLHHVDASIDSGAIIAQQTIKPEQTDNFASYPILQYCEGLKLIKTHLKTLHSPHYIPPLTSGSKLYYHPTLFLYLNNRISRAIR